MYYVQYTFVLFFNFDSIASKNFHIIFIPLDAGFRGSQDTHLKLYLEKIEKNNISYFGSGYFYEPSRKPPICVVNHQAEVK